MNDTYKIRSIGGSLLVAIPQLIARHLELRSGDNVRITVTPGGVITIRPAKKPSTKGKK